MEIHPWTCDECGNIITLRNWELAVNGKGDFCCVKCRDKYAEGDEED